MPARSGARYFSNSFSNSTPDLGITLTPTLGVAGGIYRVDHTFSSSAGNVSADLVLGVTNVAGCALSWTNTTSFQSAFGNSTWQTLGYLTNDPGSTTPTMTFYFADGTVNAGAQRRLLVDCFRFSFYQPCLEVPVPSVIGPLASNLPNVIVTGVASNATHVAVYQDRGSGMVKLGELAVTNPPATVSVPVTGLVKGAQAAATQKVGGSESCVPAAGVIVGGGANPSLRLALSIRENVNLTGPVGTTGGGTNANIYFLGASNVLAGGGPDLGVIVQPGTNWQTVTFTRGGDPFNPIDPVVLWNNGNGADATLDGDFGALDGLAIACEGDNGPFEIYLDDLANGTNGVFQDWESATNSTLAYGFSQPSYSGTTAPNLLSAPSEARVVTAAAASGTQSLRVRWQFQDGATNRWLRLVTAGATPVQNPQVDLKEPISVKILLLPGGVAPVSPIPPPLAITLAGNAVILSWPGSYQLQRATNVAGAYLDVPGATTAPHTNAIGPAAAFFRLRNP